MKVNDVNKGISMELISGILFGMIGMWSRFLSDYGIDFIGATMICNISFVVLNGCYMLIFKRDMFQISKSHLLVCLIQGVLISNILRMSFYYASEVLPVGICATILFCMVFPLMLVSKKMFNEKIGKEKILSAGFSFLGVCLVLNVFTEGGVYPIKGIVLMIITLLMATAQVSLNNYLIDNGRDAIGISFYYSLFAMLSMWPFVTPFEAIGASAVSLTMLMLILGFALINVLSLVLMTNGLKYITATQLGICQALDPITATLLGVYIFGDRFSVMQMIGLIIIIGFVVYVSKLDGKQNNLSLIDAKTAEQDISKERVGS